MKIRSEKVTNQVKIGAISLFIGALLNLTRLFPIFLNNDTFPPKTTEVLTNMTLNDGWIMSHIMGFLSTPLVIIGIWVLYDIFKKRNRNTVVRYAFVFIMVGMILYGIAVGVDGLLLPQASSVLNDSINGNYEMALMIQNNVHALALMFGSLSLIANLFGGILLGISFIRETPFRSLGFIGVLYGVLVLILLLLNVIDIFMHNNFEIGAGSIFAIHLWFVPIAVYMYKGKLT